MRARASSACWRSPSETTAKERSAIAPTPASVNKVTREDLEKFHSEYYAPNNAILGVAGDVEFDAVVKLIRKYFGGWKSHPVPAAKLPPHNHPVAPPVSNASGTSSSPINGYPAVDVTTLSDRSTATTMSYAASPVQGQSGGAYQTGNNAGGGLPLPTEPPYLVLNFIIALQGIFPTRQ